jgi:hypothetical protein
MQWNGIWTIWKRLHQMESIARKRQENKKTVPNLLCRKSYNNIYNTSQNSLALAGVANSVQQIQELVQATRSGFISISERQEEQDAVNACKDVINASVLQMVASRSADGMDDNATAFSAMTASSAVKDRRVEDLELKLRRANSNFNTGPPPTGGSSGGSAFPWRGRGGGRNGGRGGGCVRGNYRSRADGPAKMTKNSKYWKADTLLLVLWVWLFKESWSSKKCEHKATEHQDAATWANPMGGSYYSSTKDKEYSKWKWFGWEQQANNIEKKDTDSATETVHSSILKTSTNYKFNTNKLETPSINKIAFSNTTLVAICNDKFNSHVRHTIYNHNPDWYTARSVRSTG